MVMYARYLAEQVILGAKQIHGMDKDGDYYNLAQMQKGSHGTDYFQAEEKRRNRK